MRLRWLAWMMGLVLVGCGRTQPQRPTFKGQVSDDAATVQVLVMNQQMAAQADVQLAHQATEGFVLMNENYWVRGLYPQRDNEPTLQEGEFIAYQAEYYTMSDTLLTNHQVSAKMGQIEDIAAIVQVLPLMQHAMHVTMLVPWYLAFGSAGNENVPPYENIRVEMEVQ